MGNVTREYAYFPYDEVTRKALTGLNLTTVYDIVGIEEERFRHDYDIPLNGCAAAIYSQAKTYLPLANTFAEQAVTRAETPVPFSMLPAQTYGVDQTEGSTPSPDARARITRHRTPVWQALFGRDVSRYAQPGSLQSLDSPVSYLLYLLNLLRSIRDGESNAMVRLFLRRPDLKTLLLTEDTVNQPVPASELAGRILMDAVEQIKGLKSDDRATVYKMLGDALSPLTMPFDAAFERTRLALTAVSLSVGALLTRGAKDYRLNAPKREAALAWSGLSPALVAQLTAPLPAKLAPVTLCFKSTTGTETASEGNTLIDLSQLWPGQSLSGSLASDISITLKAADGQSVEGTLVNATKGATRSHTLSLAKEPDRDKVYRGVGTLTITAPGQTRKLVVSVVLSGSNTTADGVATAFAEEKTQLTSTLGAEIAEHTAAVMNVPAEMLSQVAGLSTPQLIAFLSGGDGAVTSRVYPAVTGNGRLSGACYIWGTAAGVANSEPGRVQEGMLILSPYQLLRLQKFVRLLNHTDIPAADLDLIVQSALAVEGVDDITVNTLRALGVYRRYRETYGMTAAEFACQLSAIPMWSHNGQIALWDTLFAGGNVMPDEGGGSELNDDNKALIAAAGGMTPSDINGLITLGWDKKRTQSDISSLLRPALLAKRLGLKVTTLLDVMALITGGERNKKETFTRLSKPTISDTPSEADTLDALLLLDEVLSWLNEHAWPVEEVVALVSDDLTAVQKTSLQTHANAVLAQLNTSLKLSLTTLTAGQFAPVLAGMFSVSLAVATAAASMNLSVLNALLTESNTSLTPLLLSLKVIHRFNLSDTALHPLLVGGQSALTGSTASATLTGWLLLLHLSDYAWLASGEEAATPAVIALSGENWQTRLAKIFYADNVATQTILKAPTYASAQHALLARRVALAERSGWTLKDITQLCGQTVITQDERLSLSLRAAPRDASERQAVADRFGEVRNQALMSYYQTLCRNYFIQLENLSGENAFNEHYPDTAEVAGQLLSDARMTAKVTTSRVSEAIAAVQAFIHRILEGQESELQLTASELQRWQEIDSQYAVWAANVQLRWHPDQYILPAGRLNKTPAFKTFEGLLSQSRLNDQQVEDALTGYLTEFEQTVNLDTVAGFQEGMDADSSPLYFLGRTKKAPYDYWFRRWGNNASGVRVWSAWSKIALPMQQDILLRQTTKPEGWETNWSITKADGETDFNPVQARLVMLSGRLYFIWVSVRAVADDESTPVQGKSAESTPAPVVKKYRHVISAVHQRIDGGWSIPVELWQGATVVKEHIDVPPHLNAFVIPENSADLNPLLDTTQVIPSGGDVLMVTLMTFPLEGGQSTKNTTHYLMFDTYLSALLGPQGLNRKDFNDKLKQNELLQKYIAKLNRDSWLWTKQPMPHDAISDTGTYVSTRVMTPCVPGSWLFNGRRMLNRGQAVFGNQVTLTLGVQDAGQTDRNSYRVDSTVRLTEKQLAALPAGYKLVHFMTWQGVSRYSRVTAITDKVSVFDAYGQSAIRKGRVRHGLVLVNEDASDVVYVDGAKDTLTETGELRVAHSEVQDTAAEIRHNHAGVQFLVTWDPHTLDSGDDDASHGIHANNAPLNQTVNQVPDVRFKLVAGDVQNDPAPLNKDTDWSDALFSPGEDKVRDACWSYDLTAKDASGPLQLITRIENPVAATVSAVKFGDGVFLMQSGKPLKAKDIDKGKPLFIVTPVKPGINEQAQGATFSQISRQPDITGFTKMRFRFRVAVDQGDTQELKAIGLRMVSQRALDEHGETLMTKADWGWLRAHFIPQGREKVLDRRYQLLSGDPQYFVMKITVPARDERDIRQDLPRHRVVGLSLRLQQTSASQATKVYGLTTGGKVASLKVTSTSDEAGFVLDNGAVTLVGPDTAALNAFLDNYTFFFVALPWMTTPQDASMHGLTFVYDALDKKQATFTGRINVDMPALSRVRMTASCTPARISLGDTATVRVEVNTGGEVLASDATLTVHLDDAWQLQQTGIITSAVGMKTTGNTVVLSGLPARGSLSFVFPVKAISAVRLDPVLATVTLNSDSSAVRVALKTPEVEDLSGQITARLSLRHGANPENLLNTDATVPLTVAQLNEKYLVAAVTVTADSTTERDVITTLWLPEGLNYQNDKMIQQALKLSSGEQLVTTPRQETVYTDRMTQFSVQTHLSPGQHVTLLFPLKLATGQPRFIAQLQASLQTLQAGIPFWSDKTAPFSQPAKDLTGTLEVSASWQADQLIPLHGSLLTLELMIKAIKASTDNVVTLKLGQGYSAVPDAVTLNNQRVRGALYDPLTGTLTLPKSMLPMLGENAVAVLRFPVTAQADPARTDKSSDVTHFNVTSKESTNGVVTPNLPLPHVQLRGSSLSTHFYETGQSTPLADSVPLVKGKTYECRVSLFMPAADINRQTAQITESGAQVTVLKLTLPSGGFTYDANKVKVEGMSEAAIQGLKALKLETAKIAGMGAGSKLLLCVGCLPEQDVKVTFTVPVTVADTEKLVKFSITLAPAYGLKARREWLANITTTTTLVRFTTWDPNNAPYRDLHFSHGGDDAFSDPVNLLTPVLLDDGQPTPAYRHRLVRLNSDFGRELVQTAGRDVRILFEPTIQDRPLPPMVANGVPDTLEQDGANLPYFWELFFHVPMLIARQLNGEGRYQEAQRWLNRLFDPFSRAENGLPPNPWKCRLLKARFSYVSVDVLQGLADPDLIASYQPVYYQRAVFFAYVQNVMDEGDSQFRTLSRDGFNNAHQCYLLASRLLGEEDQTGLLPAWTASVLEKSVPDYAQAILQKGNARLLIPRSRQHHDLLSLLQQRLYNLRHGLTLDGKPLSLPLYDTPLDPMQLQRDRASGITSGGAGQDNAVTTLFRYSVLYPRASAAVDLLMQFGSQLLTYAERQDDSRYQSLLCVQQKTMAKFVLDCQQETLNLSQTARDGLEALLASAKLRQRKLKSWISDDVTNDESGALDKRSTVRQLNISGSSMMATGAGLDAIPNIFGMSNGGAHWGAIPNAIGIGLNTAAESELSDALSMEIRSGYRRRKEEWELQKVAVDSEVAQLEAQLRADTIQMRVYQRQLAQTQAQQVQFEDQLNFMQNRFTGEALWQWLSGQVATVFYQAFDVALSLCHLTEAAWRFETGAYDETHKEGFFANINWESSRRGLMAGEHLRLGLMKMDREYLTRGSRRLELRHTFSVKAADKAGWDARMKKAAGLDKTEAVFPLPFSITEKDLASRYPGHYQRQVVAVTVTLPCVVGPLDDIRAILVQKSGYFTIKKDAEAEKLLLQGKLTDALKLSSVIKQQIPQTAQVALSSGLDDAGAFVLNFNDDQLLPFEGNGVAGEWELQFPAPGTEAQKRILSSLTDAIITFHYRARDAGSDSSFAKEVMAFIGSSGQ